MSDKISLAVIGGTGRLGRLLRPALASCATVRTTWIARDRTGESDLACGDLLAATGPLRAALTGQDVVLNLAGITPAAGPGAKLCSNADLAQTVLQAAHDAGVAKVFLVSSAAVYGASARMHTETQALQPVSPYGRAKHDMEIRAMDWARDMRAPVVSILRLGNVVGADQLLGAVGRQPIALDRFADGQAPLRSYIGPRTLARIIVQLAGLQGLPNVLNIAAPKPVSMAALLRAAAVTWHFRPAPSDAIARVVLDTSVLNDLIRWESSDSDPAGMVAQWRYLSERMRAGSDEKAHP